MVVWSFRTAPGLAIPYDMIVGLVANNFVPLQILADLIPGPRNPPVTK